jgi:hypothetical protein
MMHQHAEAGKLTLDDIRDLENSVRNVRTRRGKDAKEMTADIEVLVVDAVADLVSDGLVAADLAALLTKPRDWTRFRTARARRQKGLAPRLFRTRRRSVATVPASVAVWSSLGTVGG